METVAEVRRRLKRTNEDALSDFIRAYEADEREGVQAIVQSARQKEVAYQKELARTKRMYLFEEKYAEYGLVCGIDEVGRGPLAGPVCAGAVILPADKPLLHLNDSKKLSEKVREELYDVIKDHAIAYATAFVSPRRIDEINILQATYEAMALAVGMMRDAFCKTPDTLLIDAVHVPQLETYKQVSIVRGDAQSASIAAASIIAKVDRDRLMRAYDKEYPGYGFADNKGYGAKAHIEALKKNGATPIHRRTFITKFTTT